MLISLCRCFMSKTSILCPTGQTVFPSYHPRCHWETFTLEYWLSWQRQGSLKVTVCKFCTTLPWTFRVTRTSLIWTRPALSHRLCTVCGFCQIKMFWNPIPQVRQIYNKDACSSTIQYTTILVYFDHVPASDKKSVRLIHIHINKD